MEISDNLTLLIENMLCSTMHFYLNVHVHVHIRRAGLDK